MMSILNLKDFYKVDHRSQYPKGTTKIYSNMTARQSRIEGINEVVVFGVQYLIRGYIYQMFNMTFFEKPKNEVVDYYKNTIDKSIGKDCITVDHIESLHDLGYLPLKIKSLEEGTKCPIGVPFLTITNTIGDFYWLPNFLETLISTILWGPINSATIASKYRGILDSYADKTSDSIDFVDFQGHDFSMRGMFGIEAAQMSSAAHLLSFKGTDTITAIDFLKEWYDADDNNEFIGGSIPATEHSVMCSGEKDNEFETFKRLITEVYPSGLVSIVSDTWDYWKVLTDYLPRLKDIIMSRDGKVVIRPDSGDPVKIITGDCSAKAGSPESKGTVEILYEIFGGTKNSKGYIELDPHIGCIYGDSITMDRCRNICENLKVKGFASTNVVFGIGSYTYQYNTRDTFGMAMKATYAKVNGEDRLIFKDPKTTDGTSKKSAKGLLRVNEDLTFEECVTEDQEGEGLLRTVFLDGKLFNETNLSNIRENINRFKESI